MFETKPLHCSKNYIVCMTALQGPEILWYLRRKFQGPEKQGSNILNGILVLLVMENKSNEQWGKERNKSGPLNYVSLILWGKVYIAAYFCGAKYEGSVILHSKAWRLHDLAEKSLHYSISLRGKVCIAPNFAEQKNCFKWKLTAISFVYYYLFFTNSALRAELVY